MVAGRYIFLYRMIDGKRQKMRFTVDDTLTIMAEEPCHENGIPYTTTDRLKQQDKHLEAAIAASPQLSTLKERGVQFHLEQGKVYLDHVPELEQQIAQFYLPNTKCPFPGCEALRTRYLEELKSLENEEGKCRSCDVGSLQRKYRNVIIKHIQKLQYHDTKTTVSSGN